MALRLLDRLCQYGNQVFIDNGKSFFQEVCM